MIAIHDFETPSPRAWHLVITGMRNSWESWEKGDSRFGETELLDDYFVLGESDKSLAQRLVKAGADHGKFMRQLSVIVDVTAPNYFWREFDTYHIGVTANSTSQMHTLGKHEFNADMFAWDEVPENGRDYILFVLNKLRAAWIDSGKRKGPEAKEWRAMVQAIPDSWLYRRTVSLNYQVLRAQYFARRNHRLVEWREWCRWIETLIYSDLITVEQV